MNELARSHPNVISSRPLQPAAALAEEEGYNYGERGQEAHFRDYLKILLKRIRYIIPIFCAVVVLGGLVSLFSPTLYTAQSTLKIEPQNPTVTGVAEVLPSNLESGPYDYYQTQFVLLKSGPLAARVIKKLHLEQNSSFAPKSKPGLLSSFFTWIKNAVSSATESIAGLLGFGVEQGPSVTPEGYALGVSPGLIGRYLRYLEVEPVRNTRLVNIVFSTPDPKLSRDLANTHATSFVQMILEHRFNLTKEARDFLGAKLVELRGKVQKAENELNRFRQKHGVFSLEKGENIVVDRLVDLNKQLTKARAERIESESLYRTVQGRNNQYLTQVLNNPLVQQLKATVANLETEKGRLLSIFTNEHPRVQELNQQIAEAKRGLNAEIGSIVQGIQSTYAAARAREEALEAEAKRQQDTALDLKEMGVEYAVLNEEITVNRTLYDNVLKRLNETNVANDLAASNIQVMQRAEIPSVPSSPNTVRHLMISAILGLFLAIGYAFFSEYMDATVNTPEGVWSAVTLSTLGVVPHLKSLPERYHPVLSENAPTNRLGGPNLPGEFLSKELVVARNQLSLVAESYRTIRTALLLSQAEHPPKTILLTSPCPGEGKTVTTLNLGIALAQGGNKVLVIDADMRKGRCHKLLNVANGGGLANILTGHQAVQDSVKDTAIRNVSLLSRGVLPPNPADLLMSHKMREILNEARSSFDFILIDSPPVIAVSDAAVLSALCDGVLLVFHGQKTTTPTARRAVERLDKVGAPILGVILNGIDIRDPDYVDYRSYYPSYYATVREETSGLDDRLDGVIKNVDDVDRVMKTAGFYPVTEAYRRAGRTEFDAQGGEPDRVHGKRIVPGQFFDRMVRRLSEVLGPRAVMVIRDRAVALHESMDAFPASRLRELTQSVSREIGDDQVKTWFLRSMSEEISALEKT